MSSKFKEALGIVDNRLNLPPGADHTLGTHDTFNVRLVVGGYAQGSSAAQAMERFKEIIAEKSGGKFQAELYTDGSLGSDGDLGELMEIGGVSRLYR